MTIFVDTISQRYGGRMRDGKSHYDLLERVKAWCEVHQTDFVELGTKHVDGETYWHVVVRDRDHREIEGNGLTQNAAIEELERKLKAP